MVPSSIFTMLVPKTAQTTLNNPYFKQPILDKPIIAQLVKNLPAMQETLVLFQGQKDSLEKG